MLEDISNVHTDFPDFKVSHIGLFVFNIDLMVDFFTQTFGLHVTDRGIVRDTARIVFLSRDPSEHHQVVLVEGRTVPLGERLLNQISLRVASLDGLRDALNRLRADQRVTGINPCNHGNAFSVYFLDPEQNRFEVFADSPFYVEQAVMNPLDLFRSDEELIADTAVKHAADPSFRLVEEWRADFTRKLEKLTSAIQEEGV